MRFRSLSILLLLVAGALSGAPADPATRNIRVALSAPDAGVTAVKGVITLRPIMGPHEPLTQPIQVLTETATFAVAPHTMWEAFATVPGFWAAPVSVAVQDGDTTAMFTLLPAGTVTGRLAPPAKDQKPSRLTAKVDAIPGLHLAGPPAESMCTVADDASFTCEVPAGTVDLSLHVPGYVATYRWAVKVPRNGRLDMGAIPLSSGSAVVGAMKLAGGKLQAGKGNIALFQPALGVNPIAARLSRPIAESAVAENGFFQLRDVPPGRYTLLASYPGYASSIVEGVEVYPHVEAKLPRTIELQPPMSLTLTIDPPFDHSGHPWRLELSRETLPGKFAPNAEYDGEVKGGSLTLRDQQGGHYRVQIRDTGGNPFDDEEFVTSGAASESHTFTIKAVPVKGTIRRGDQPLEATLWFGGQFGDKHVRLRSNAEGSFRGVLPQTGSWRVVVESDGHQSELRTDVTKTDDEDAARVDLVIPANHVAGVVVDASGAAYPNATVLFSNGPTVQTTRSDASGTFAFEGVPSGSFALEAHADRQSTLKASEIYRATIGAADTVSDLTLKLQDGLSIHGRVIGQDGPAIGADVKLRPGSGFDFAPISRTTSGPDGVFDIHVAPGYDRALVTVSAPGYALRVFDIAVDGHAVTLNLSQAGGALRLKVPSDAAGVVVFQDGRFVSFADLLAWMSVHGDPIPTSGNSMIAISDMAPGRYRACTAKRGATSPSDLNRCAEGFLAPYGELQLSLQ